MGYYGLSALAPFILEDWGLNRQQVGLLMSAFSTGTVLLAFPAGILTDRIGVRTVLLTGQIVIGIFVALAPWLPGYLLVLSAMLFAGMGYGLVNPAGSKAVYAWFPPSRRAAALGLKQISLPLCGVICGLVLPPLAVVLGWRGAWMSIGLAVLGGVLLTGLLYSDPQEPDVPEVAENAPSASGLALLRRGNILCLICSGFLLTGVQISWHGYLALYLKEHLTVPVVLAGIYIALMQASAMVGRPLLGILSDRFFGGERRGVLLIVGVVSAALSLWFAFLPGDSPLWIVTLIVALFGLTGVAWHGVHLAWITEMASPQTAGAASGLWICSAHLGIILLVPIFGWLVDVTATYTTAWAFAGMLACLAMISLWRIK
jgi:predicted MFS family arabinose efflux permease